ncbi:MAG: 50S ribosomal protein L30 [Spirochaetes bacterium GWF1_41_5]|nr:MAG: 50S ribosomal protein L30 [Spirochaetes bacterium GWF1_41_5]HBE03498.1 50S ribosomal protein L30 [Spirochaetia bacterium]
MAEDKIKITLIKSIIGRNQRQRNTVRSLGLYKIHDSVIMNNNPAIKGMINKVCMLVKTEKYNGQGK